MALENEDGAVEKLMEEGHKQVGGGGDDDDLKELEVSDRRENAYAGMGKEELMKYANSPFWIRLRWLLFVTFWLSWFAMMFGALFIIFMTPKCSPSSKLAWYQKSPVYVINAASLMSQGGLDEKVEYLQQLGVRNVVLSSVFDADKEEEVIDFLKVNISLGDESSMKNLISKLKNKGMKVMLKLVPNHSSTSHMYFERSILKEPLFKDYYIWNPGFSNGDKHFPINNWLSVTGESAWTWDKNRKEFYLHQFSDKEADFNFRDKNVVNYFEGIFKFWLATGFDGLYLDEVKYLFKDKDFKNETATSTQADGSNKYNSFDHKFTSNLPETKELLSNWGQLIVNNSGILIVSDLDTTDITGVDMIHSSVSLSSDFTAEQLLAAILLKKTSSSWPSWEWVCVEKPDCWKKEMIDAFSILGSLLPGTPFVNADPKLFEDNLIPNVTLIESTLKELRSMPTIEFGSFNAKLLNNDTVFAFDRVMQGSESLLFAWNLGKNTTVIDLSQLDKVPAEVNLSICTQSACSLLPPIESKVNSNNLSLPGESAVVLKF